MTADNENVTSPTTDSLQQAPASRERGGGNALWAALAIILLAAIVLLVVATRLVPRVPNVTGMTRVNAESTLKSAGYRTGAISLVSTAKTARGHVVEQAPSADTILSKGSTVDLIVVQGGDMVVVPDVVGNDAGTAAKTIGATGLGLKSVGAYSDTVPIDAVIAEVPAAGTRVAADSYVTIVVSLGSQTAAEAGSSVTTQASGAGASGTSTNGGNGLSTTPAKSAFTASYPGARVWSDHGDIYIGYAGGGGKYVSGGSAWDTDPILSPDASYVVFMRAPSQGSAANQVCMTNLTSFQTTTLDLPYPADFCSASEVRYTSMRFAPSQTGTSPGSDWLVIGQLFPGDPDGPEVGGRLLVCNVPIDSSWVSWYYGLRPSAGITISGSSTPGCVYVKSVGQAGNTITSRSFNAYTGLYGK